jgi:glutamine amidotransferase/cyclase
LREKTLAEAVPAAGIFHRKNVPIGAVKEYMREKGIETR